MAADTMEQDGKDALQQAIVRAMHSYDNAYAFKLIRLLARAQMNVVANPLIMWCFRAVLIPIPTAWYHSCQELLADGVNVALGHDSIMDPWFPLGRGDMLAAAQLALFLCHMSGTMRSMMCSISSRPMLRKRSVFKIAMV